MVSVQHVGLAIGLIYLPICMHDMSMHVHLPSGIWFEYLIKHEYIPTRTRGKIRGWKLKVAGGLMEIGLHVHDHLEICKGPV